MGQTRLYQHGRVHVDPGSATLVQMKTLWSQLPAAERARHLDSLRAGARSMARRDRDKDLLPSYEATIELLEAEEERVSGVVPRPHRPFVRLVLETLVAALLLTPLDAVQVRAGVLTAGRWPWLAPVKFGLLGLALGLIANRLQFRGKLGGRLTVAFDVALFVEGYLMTAALPDHPNAVAVFLGALLLVGAAHSVLRGIAQPALAFVVLLGVAGPLIEILGVQLGWFRYAQAQLWGVPAWLPLLWMLGAFTARDLFLRNIRSS